MTRIRLIMKWLKMLLGKSTLHVLQDEGRIYSKNSVRGYYNDLTQKVLKQGVKLDSKGVVYNITNEGESVYFPIAIFQYGLGSYDLYLITNEENYLKSFYITVDWALENQNNDGSWDTFSVYKYKNPYSAMAQGEAASLLLRAFLETDDNKYLDAAKKAIDFMCKPIKEGGTAEYFDGEIRFKEVIDLPVILNGWIFALWGLFDYVKITNDRKYTIILNNSLDSLEKSIKHFDIGFWSKYDIDKKITSPFYHRLHIAQLKVMYDLFDRDVFKKYQLKWEKYEKNILYKMIAFIIKAKQKLSEKNNNVDIVG